MMITHRGWLPEQQIIRSKQAEK